MPQSDGKHSLKRMEFAFKGKSFKFSLNPEEYTQDEISRSNVTQTKAGAWIDDFGAGLPTIYMKGTTGFKKGTGAQKFVELRNFFREYINNGNPGEEIKDEMTFHNYTDGESWIVHVDPNAFRLLRSKTNPLLYMYEIRLQCLRPAQIPSDATKSAKGGVNETLGTPARMNAPAVTYSAPQAIAQNYLASTLVPGLYPNASLTSFIGTLRTLPDGQVQDSVSISQGISRVSAEKYSAEVNQINPKFTPTVSMMSMDMLKDIKSGNVKTTRRAVEKEGFLWRIQKLRDDFIPQALMTAVKSVLLEIFSIYENLGMEEQFPKKMSEMDLVRVINNVQWVSDELSKLKRPDYDLIEEFRWIERSLRYVLNSTIYNKDYKDEVKKLESLWD